MPTHAQYSQESEEPRGHTHDVSFNLGVFTGRRPIACLHSALFHHSSDHDLHAAEEAEKIEDSYKR